MMRNRVVDRIATGILWLSGLFIIALLAWFLYHILAAGLPHLTWHFITGQPEEIRTGGGVGPQLFNSFYILLLSLLFSLPIGFSAGIYLAVYARQNRLTDFIRLCVESLSSVPSIVFGLFGALLFVKILGFNFSVLSGSLTLALLNLPVLVRVTEVAVKNVPSSYWQASMAMGSTRWQAIKNVLVPAALPSLITGVTLVAGRALGESAILIYTSGLSVSRYFPDFNPLAMGETLSVHLWYVRAESLVPDAAQIAEGSAALLILVVLAFNLLIALPSRLLQRKMAGKK